MQTVNIHAAKTHLSRLLEAVEWGKEIIIARSGQPVAMLTAYKPQRPRIAPPGSMEGEIRIEDDFDDSVDALFDCLKFERYGSTVKIV